MKKYKNRKCPYCGDKNLKVLKLKYKACKKHPYMVLTEDKPFGEYEQFTFVKIPKALFSND